MLLRDALVLGLLLAAAFGVWEVRRWSLPGGGGTEGAGLISPRQRVLRAWGLFFLIASLGLWLGGTYLATPRPGDTRALIRWIQYWILTTLAALPLIPLALLDWRENLRQLTESRRRLYQETLAPLARTHPDDADPPTKPA
jgi:hypothetical protein